MKATLLIRLAGPMQSWGTQSRFSVRDTGLEPSKSGVIGLVCAALGWQREQERFSFGGGTMCIEEFARALLMAVRVDRGGRMSRDFQTAGGEHRAGSVLGFDAKGRPRPYGVAKADDSGTGTVTSNRYYLADADFLVGLEGDRALLEAIDAKLASPHWPLYLGRKAFVPSLPVRLGPPVDADLPTTIKTHPWRRRRRWDKPHDDQLRLVSETNFGEGPEVRYDVPVSFAARTFALRHVRTDFIPAPRLEDDPCST